MCFVRRSEKARADLNVANIVNIAHDSSVTADGPGKENTAPKVGFVNTLKIPNVKGLSEAIHKVTKKCLNDKMRVVFSCGSTLRKMLMHVKPKKKPILKNCVYQIDCECKAQYIGQTNNLTETQRTQCVAYAYLGA
jgi:hypothetical protein